MSWRRVFRAPLTLVRRSLLVRVVATALALGIVCVAALSLILTYQISHGLFNSRLQEALGESSRLITAAQNAFDSSDSTSLLRAQTVVEDTISSLQSSGSSTYAVALLRTTQSGPEALPDVATDASVVPLVTPALSKAVSGSANAQWQSVSLAGTPARPGLIIGSRVAVLSGEYGLYFVYDLSPQQQTLTYIEEVLAIGGGILVLVLGGIVWLAARLAVVPLRSAAKVAKDLAGGDLDERMAVHGQTEMASLAIAFNDMAGNLQLHIGQMEQLSQIQRRFVSDVSHELRTPLTTIRMAGDVLYAAKEDFAPDIARTAELLSDQLDRFDSLLADLLEISRIDAGAAIVERAGHDVRDVAQAAIDQCAPLAAAKDVLIVREFSPDECVADIDVRRISRIVRNLLVNAIEHAESHPVEIYVRANDNAVAVVVKDHGVGMNDAELEHVFDRFWRGDPSRARTTGGTGLGLAISLEDAQLHGGRLDATGAAGEGASFRLVVPREPTASPSPSPLLLDGTAQ